MRARAVADQSLSRAPDEVVKCERNYHRNHLRWWVSSNAYKRSKKLEEKRKERRRSTRREGGTR